MKIKNQWIVFLFNADKLLVETESGEFFVHNRSNDFEKISKASAEQLINAGL